MRTNVFQHKCLRKILKVHWPMKVSNEEIREISNTRTFDELVRSRRCKWLGHVLTMRKNMNPKIALTWAPKGKRSRRRPRETWRRTVVKERAQLGSSTWNEAETAAKDRATWKEMTDGPPYSPPGEKGLIMMRYGPS